MRIGEITCNGRRQEAVAFDHKPLFSWLLSGEGVSCRQRAYRLLVKADVGCSHPGEVVWDSGLCSEGRTQGIVYAGMPLEAMSRYRLELQVYAEGREEPLDGHLYFDTAFPDGGCLPGAWIGHGSLLRRTICLRETPVYARLAVTGLGYYEAYINGNRVGEDTLAPSYTWYDRRIEYNCFDVLSVLHSGANGIGIELAGHWHQNPDGSEQKCYQGCYYTGALRAKACLRVVYADGSEQYLTTDAGWRESDGPVVHSGIYDGEYYDASRRKKGYSTAEYDDADWRPVKVLEPTGAKEICASLPPIRRIREVSPRDIRRLDNGDFVVDFGENLAGRCRLRVDIPAGTVAVLRHAEVQRADGSIDPRNLRWAKACDTYVSAGSPDIYEPRFTYHGFRYVQIKGLQTLKPEDIVLVEVRSAVETTGHFSCTDDRLNQLHDIMRRTITNNLHSIPTDCCQRDERQGWLGDGQLTSEAAIANWDMQYFYRKWLEDMADSQNEEGNLPFVTAPAWAGGEALSWTCAYFEIAGCLYRFYNDMDAVSRHYEGLCRYFHYLGTREDADGLLTLSGLCDWLALEPTEEPQIRDAIYYRIAVTMAELAKALGKTEDRTYFLNKAQAIKNAYNNKYYSCHAFTDRQSGYYGTCYYVGQTANALPMAYDMVDPADLPRVTEKLLYELTESMGGLRLTTGFIGTRVLVETLMKIERNDIVWDLLHQDAYPSYGFMLAHGATTVWERWQYRTDNEMNSHCHPPLAAPDVWFYRVVGGIREFAADTDGRGHFVIRPDIALPLTAAKASQKTIFGEICVEWEKTGQEVTLLVEVPANTSAEIVLGNQYYRVLDGQHRFTYTW